MISDSTVFNNKSNAMARDLVDCEREKARLTLLVDEFADAMKKRLIEKIGDNNHGGWEDEDWTNENILDRAQGQLESTPDPVDAANFCAFLWNRTADAPTDSGDAVAPNLEGDGQTGCGRPQGDRPGHCGNMDCNACAISTNQGGES